jgi:hypothetical protein
MVVSRAIIFIMLAASCSSSDPASPSADAGIGASADGGDGAATTSCRYDDECAAGLICAGDGNCVDAAACDQDFHCSGCTVDRCGFAGDGICDQGGCRRPRPQCAPCETARQCGDDPVTGLPHPCVALDQGNVCALESSQRECPAGQMRHDDGYCLPPSCTAPLACSSDADCPLGRHCSQRAGETGLCLAFCRDDSECPNRGWCDRLTGSCHDACTADSCPSNHRCHDDGRCGPPCGADTDCDEGFSCRDDRCRLPGCSSDADCPPRFGIYCDVGSRACREGCLRDEHCSATQICRAGQCALRPCRSKELDCNLGQFCCGTGSFGDGGDACPAGVEFGACFDFPDGFCAPCQESDDCRPASQHGSDSVCIEYQDRDSNALGKACALGCRDLADCPRGFGCSELRNESDQVVGSVCTAALCVTGELAPR